MESKNKDIRTQAKIKALQIAGLQINEQTLQVIERVLALVEAKGEEVTIKEVMEIVRSVGT